MQLKKKTLEWNEIEYISWQSFKQMGPSILQLEVTRLGKLMATFQQDTDFHNTLVRARYALTRFIACLETTEKETVHETCGPFLDTALLALAYRPSGLDPEAIERLDYIVDRVRYVHHRIAFIY